MTRLLGQISKREAQIHCRNYVVLHSRLLTVYVHCLTGCHSSLQYLGARKEEHSVCLFSALLEIRFLWWSCPFGFSSSMCDQYEEVDPVFSAVKQACMRYTLYLSSFVQGEIQLVKWL